MDIIAKNLGRNKGIILLSLKSVAIDDECCKNLSNMLAANKFMKSLDLSENKLTCEGIKEVMKALEKN